VDSYNVSKFLYEDVICPHGLSTADCFGCGKENFGFDENSIGALQNPECSHFGVSSCKLMVSLEGGQQPIINSLVKYCGGSPQLWPQYLSLALWADGISVRRSTGYSAFELLYGRECVLPVELMIESWQTVDWDGVQSRDDLILARMQQLDNRRVTETLAAANLHNSRKGNKIYFDQHHHLRPESQQLRVGDLVLLFDSALQKLRNKKLLDNWRGPY
jgi:hypothetical protein